MLYMLCYVMTKLLLITVIKGANKTCMHAANNIGVAS